MVQEGPLLLALTAGTVGLLLVLILAGKMHAFLALIISAIALGVSVGMEPMAVISSVKTGMGDTLGGITIILVLGGMIGRFLEHSGGGRVLAEWFLEKFGDRYSAWAVLAVSFLIGLPIFFDVAFIIMAPIIWNLAKKSKKSMLYYGLPMGAALGVVHGLVPPHPPPVAAAGAIGADIGQVVVWGILVSIPMTVVSGIFWGTWISRKIFVPVPEIADAMAAHVDAGEQDMAPPSVGTVLFVLILPLALIFGGTLAGVLDLPGQGLITFIGDPVTALFIGTFGAALFLGFRRGINRANISKMMDQSLGPIASILVIVGAGGALKQVITDCGVGPYAANLLVSTGISPLIVAYVITVLVRVTIGSTTVSVITAAGIIGPIIDIMPSVSPVMATLAMCCGGTFLSHVNDSGFWIVGKYLGVSVPDTLKSWSVMKVIDSLVGISVVLALNALFF